MADLKAQLQIGADVSGVEAGITKAKRSINSLGVTVQDSNTRASKSIDRYVRSLEQQAATMGKSSRETELYKLALKGASDAQLKAADSALKLKEGFEKGEEAGARMRANFVALGVAAATGLIAAAVAFDQLIKKAGDFQDLAEKTGDSAEAIASLAVAAGTAGSSMEEISGFAIRLTKNLTGVDDESKAAGAAITALGLDLKAFKELKPADQIEEIAKALDKFQDGAGKTAVLEALAKGGAQLLPFLKELGNEGGRQVILTQEQIRLAQAYATELLPALNEFGSTIAQIVKDQNFAATGMAVLKGALAGAVVVFQTIAIVASEVGFVFLGVGREIGAIIAQLGALARLDLNGFRAISEAVRQDAERARKELDRFQATVMSIGKEVAPKFADPRLLGSVGSIAEQTAGSKPKLTFGGAVKAGTDTAAQEAKAKLAFDLDQIKKASEAIVNTFSNAEKILEARRAAGLTDEREYYAAKLGFLRLNADEQERALAAELARLKEEKVTDKNRLDLKGKIAETEAKLAKVRADAVAQQVVLGIQEAAALKKTEQAYIDATTAAEAYLAALGRRNQREIEGIGRGKKFREQEAGRNDIEDRFLQERQKLERDLRRDQITQADFDTYLNIARETYAAEVKLYEERTAAIDAKQMDWATGATEALQNYYDESLRIADGVENAITNAFKGMEDALVDFVRTGKLDFKDLADSIIADITRIIVKQQILGPLSEMLQGGMKSGDGIGGFFGNILSGIFGGGRAIGGPVSAGKVYRVNENGPEMLQMAGKQFLLMGNQNGNVTAAPQDSGSVSLSINQTFQGAVDRRTMDQAAAAAAAAAQRALARNR
jgi:lambda family phage tail tape measure protein